MQYRHKSLAATCLAALFLVCGKGHANWLVENDVALGFEGGNLSYGFSMKIPHSSDTLWQFTANTGTNIIAAGGRYISNFSEWNEARVYWFAGVGIWAWSGSRFSSSETVLGVSGGIGWDYDLTKLGVDAPISVNANIGPSYVAWKNYGGLDLINLGLGIHYRFE